MFNANGGKGFFFATPEKIEMPYRYFAYLYFMRGADNVSFLGHRVFQHGPITVYACTEMGTAKLSKEYIYIYHLKIMIISDY